MAKIENYSGSVSASSLSTAELIVTFALILRGNYTGKNRTYITFRGARNAHCAETTISNACEELGIPFKSLQCDKNPNYRYLWGANLDLVLAKQGLLPDGLSWKFSSKIPEPWKDLSADKLKILERLATQLLIPKVYKQEQVYLIKDSLFFNFNNGLCELFKPIAPCVKVEFSNGLRKPYISGLVHSIGAYEPLDLSDSQIKVDDFSDLM